MKHGSFNTIRVAACLFLAFAAVFSTFGDEVTNQLESKVIESFNGDSEYTWKLEASKFTSVTRDADGNATDEFPKMAYVSAWPVAAFGYNRGGDETTKSLGIHGRFDRRGYNWIDLYPVNGGDGDDADEPMEIHIPGRVRNMDMWIWGSNFNYYMEIYLRDNQGVVHNIRLGSINHQGWKNLRVNVPHTIPQSKRLLPRVSGLSFVKFRIWTQPTERVNDFYVYFKQFKVLTDMFDSLFDGNELADPDHVQELWANAE